MMKVICAGMWKTGTKSLAVALRILGYDVYDCDEQIMLLEMWEGLADGTITDEEIRKSLEKVDAIVDGPGFIFWYEIYKQFPDAKVILNYREVDSWYESYKRFRANDSLFFYYLLSCIPTMRRMLGIVAKIWPMAVGEFQFSDNPRLTKLKYEMHNEFVRAKVPPGRLLEFQSQDGWEPLCNFLEVKDVPEQPFPHKNKDNSFIKMSSGERQKGEAFKKVLRRVIIETVIILLVIIILFTAILYKIVF